MQHLADSDEAPRQPHHRIEDIVSEIADAASGRRLPLLPPTWPVRAPSRGTRWQSSARLATRRTRFDWDSTSNGNATIRVAKLGDEVMIFREYRSDRFGKMR